jgi:hypothetical protein
MPNLLAVVFMAVISFGVHGSAEDRPTIQVVVVVVGDMICLLLR